MFGGVYCLKRSIKEIHFTNNDDGLHFDSIECGSQQIKGKNIVFGHGSIGGVKFNGTPESINGTI